MSLLKTVFKNRAILSLSGPDTRSFLQGIITQDTARLAEHKALYSALLTPQGKLIADFFLFEEKDDIFLDCDIQILETLNKKLRLYKLRSKVDIDDVTANWRPTIIWSSENSLPDIPMTQGSIVYPDPRLSALGYRVYAPSNHSGSLDVFSAEAASEEDWDKHRIDLGVPVFNHDFGPEEIFPLDVNMDAMDGIDYAKGCFVGQEVASRMKRKGEIRKRTWQVNSNTAPLNTGVRIVSGEITIGEVTSCQNNTGLALVRLDRLTRATEPVRTEDGVSVTLSPPAYLKDQQ